jgi:hypothetical protein
MKSIASHIIIGALVAALGSALVCTVGVISRHNSVVDHMEAARQLRSKSPSEALEKLLKVESWANSFPDLATEYGAELIRCYVQSDKSPEAIQHSKWMHATSALRSDGLTTPSSFPLGNITHDVPTKIYNKFNKPTAASAFRGYEVLVDELARKQDTASLSALQPMISSADPNHSLLNTIAKYLSRSPGSTQPSTPEPTSETYAKQQPESVKPEQVQSDGPVKYWGIVREKDSPAWDTSGRLMRKLEPGILVDITNVRRQQRKADLALCNVQWKDRMINDVYITLNHLEIREGSLAEASAKEKQLRKRNAELQVALADYEEELKNAPPSQAASTANIEGPEDYKRAKAAMNEFYAKASKLQKEFDASTGARRIEIKEQLWGMKHEEARLKNELDRTKAGYEEWRAKNGGGGASTPAPRQKDPKLAELQRALSEVLNDLKNY